MPTDLSIWERNHFTQFDIIIIGSGIVGLCTAYYLSVSYPEKRIIILERGLIPSGASTKNAGFACMGSLTELLDDLQHMPEQAVVDLFEMRRQGLTRLQSILGKDAMGYQQNGSYELIMSDEMEALDYLDRCNLLLKELLHADAFSLCNHLIPSFGFKGVEAMVQNLCEAEIDTGQMMSALIGMVTKNGVQIKTGSDVAYFEEHENGVELVLKNPLDASDFKMQADHLFICNNAFAKKLLPEADIAPGRGQVLITQPINELPFKGIFHLHKGYYYFRAYQNRVLLGGGRHKDFEGETTCEFGLHPQLQNDLDEMLRHLILPNQAFEIDLRWSGIMAFGPNKKPIVEQYSPRIFAGVRMGGMGVAIGSQVAFQLSEMYRKNRA